MTATTAYTPLESLLLFQALRSEGVNSHAVFNRISEQLKKISIVRDDPTYDSGRLSPDGLRELYLWLLKKEVKEDLERQSEKDDLLQNGTIDSSKRKRKVVSPTLPTVHEATQHAHLIPQLVTRLYARYREATVRDIREQERTYYAAKQEIAEIEEGKWDERLHRQRTASRTQSPRPSTSAQTQDATTSARPSPAATADRGDSSKATASSVPYKGNKINDVINHGPDQPSETERHRRTSSGNVLPPLSEMAPQSPRFGIPPKVPGPLTTQISNHGYSYSPTSGHQSPYAPHHGHPVGNPLASPQVQQSMSRPSSSPRPILPPPPGMKLPPPSPVQHSASPNSYAPPLPGQQPYPQPVPHRLPTTQSPTTDRPRGYGPNPAHHMPQPPQQGYYPPQPYPDRRTSYPPPQPQAAYPMQGARTGGYQLPPFAVDPNQPVPQQYGQTYHQIPTDGQRPPHPTPYPSTAPTSAQRPGPPNRVVSDIIAALATPPRSSRNRTFKRRPTDLQIGTPIPSPVTEVEPLSPVLKRSEPAGRSNRSTRQRGNAEAENSVEPEAEPTTRSTRTRGRAKRDVSPHSVVSSTADDSARVTRSHSVSTAAGALQPSDDRPGSRGHVKVEPSTPAAFVEVPEAEATSGGRMTRKRRGTLQSQPQQPPSKRSRQRSPDNSVTEDVDWSTPPPRPTTVTATRNFHKMSATIINDINSHKHASYFANPVRDKDAPGYSAIIKQPQNLKAIRSAIAAGAKAVNAASATLESPTNASASGDATTVELERTADLMPPRAIVNGAQLEKEVLRILANAVMFNPGEDGMVLEAKDMWEDVGTKLEAWRGTEREVGDTAAAGEVEDEGEREGRGKRRKIGA